MKAQADLLYLLVQGFVVSIAIIAIIFAWYQISSSPVAQQQLFNTPTGQTAVTNTNNVVFTLADAVAILWIISAIASCIAAFFIDSAPVFAVIGFIVLPIECFLSLLFHDLFFSIATNSFFAPVVNQMPLLVNFFIYLPFICMGFGVLIVLVTFWKPN